MISYWSNGLDIESIVSELCSVAPALCMDGYFKLLDADNQQNFKSTAGSDSFEEEWIEIIECLYCGNSLDSESAGVYVDEDGDVFCNEDCYKNYLIEAIMDEDEETDEDELRELSLEELKERFDEI